MMWILTFAPVTPALTTDPALISSTRLNVSAKQVTQDTSASDRETHVMMTPVSMEDHVRLGQERAFLMSIHVNVNQGS